MGLLYWDDWLLEEEKEDDRLVAESRDIENKNGNKKPLILNVRLPFWNNLRSDADFVENKESDLAINFCRTTSLVNLPIHLRSSDAFVESLRHRKRTQSANDIGDLFVECASSVAGSDDVMVGPSPGFMLDSVERTVMARSFLKSSLFFQLGTLGSPIRPFKAPSFSFSPMKNPKLAGSSPLRACSPLPREPSFEATPPSSQISSLKRSESLLVPCSSTSSTSSYQSNSHCRGTFSKGLLYYVWKNGSLNLLFKESDDEGKVYVASFHKIESSVDKAMDYLYVFRSWVGNEAAEITGKMKVFSSLIVNPNRSKSVETEFVLFGVREHPRGLQCSPLSSAMRNKGLSRKMAKMFRPNNPLKCNDMCKIGESGFRFETILQDPAFSKASDYDSSCANGLRPSLELAAIVVKRPANCAKKEADTGGWGLKFLEKVTTCQADTSTDTSLYSESIDVLIPVGFHGDPVKDGRGPSTLNERWRSGGHCDCGGWDIGCPLTVLHDQNPSVPKPDSNDDLQEDCKTVDLFFEGAKNAEPALKMVWTTEGLFTVYFRPTLSALQAFSVGVSIIHSQTPELHPTL